MRYEMWLCLEGVASEVSICFLYHSCVKYQGLFLILKNIIHICLGCWY